MGANIFLNYASEDRALALDVGRRLEAAGFASWTDAALSPGEAWGDSFRAALDNTDVVVAVMSNASQDSINAMMELGAALGSGKRIVLVRISDQPLHFSLRDTIVVEAAGLTAGEIADAVATRLEAPEQLTP